MNCPFYGFAMFSAERAHSRIPFVLLPSGGNQCALLIGAHAPCYMEINHLPVEWTECPHVKDLRLGSRET